MPRIRSIKPEFFTSESVAAVGIRARYTWIGLWTHCDDAGRCRDNLRLIHAALFPLDEDVTADDVAADLEELHRAGRIVRYVVNGRRLLEVVNWSEHQKPNRPQPSQFPGPDQGEVTLPESVTETAVTRHGSDALPPVQLPTLHRSVNDSVNGAVNGAVQDDDAVHHPSLNDSLNDSLHPSLNDAVNEASPCSEPITAGEEGRGGEREKERRNVRAERADVDQLCTHLHSKITENGSKAAITDRWRTEARLLLDRDKRDLNEALQLIDWCQDHHFWRSNILGMPKFRQQYDKLRLQSEQPHASNGHQPFRNPTDPSVYYEDLL